MNFDERLTQTQAKLDEVKARINTSIDSAKEAQTLKKKDIIVKLGKMDAAVSDFNKNVEAQVLCDVTSMKEEVTSDVDTISAALDQLGDKIESRVEKDDAECETAAEKLQAKFDDDKETIEGDINAAEEDIRLAKERYEGKLNSTRLKVQMHLEQIKAKINAKKTEIDKAAQEEMILDLLDYADDCQMIALSYAMEAELAILEACDEIEDYEEKYGEIEE